VFCRDGSGAPVGYPMNVTAVNGTTIVFTTYAQSAKVAHLRVDPRAAVILLEERDDEVGWLLATGAIAIAHAGPDEVDALFASRAQDPRVPESVTRSVRDRLLTGKRVLLRFTPDDPASLVVRRDRLPVG
jgi:hypothetical protein